jgi:hypothetical protein
LDTAFFFAFAPLPDIFRLRKSKSSIQNETEKQETRLIARTSQQNENTREGTREYSAGLIEKK